MSQLLKIEAPSFPLGLFSRHSIRDISLHKQSSFVGATIGTHIDSDISLLMPLRFVRQAVANGRRSRLYYTHKGSRTSKTSELMCVLYDESVVFGVWDEERKAQRRTTATCCG